MHSYSCLDNTQREAALRGGAGGGQVTRLEKGYIQNILIYSCGDFLKTVTTMKSREYLKAQRGAIVGEQAK
jgi:hypothetical protein